MERGRFWLVAAAAATIFACVSVAQGAEEYKGRTITLIVSAGAGGGYGQVGQILTRHMSKHIPGNPNMVVQFMPAAGGLQAANYLYNAAAGDGTVIGLLRNSTAFGQAMKLPGLKYDAAKLHWIGSVEPIINVLAARRDSGITSLDDLKKKELIVGAAGKLDTLYIFPTVMQKMLGYKFKVVSGYRGTADVRGALDRKEVNGMVQPFDNWVKSHFHKSNSVSYLTQFAYARMKTLPDVPTLVELAREKDETSILRLVSVPSVLGRNIAAPPKTDKARVATLRTAFDATMKDPAFAAEMKKAGRHVIPRTGAEVEKLVTEVLATPPALVERTRQYLGY